MLANVSANLVYEWVRTGHWNLNKFARWLGAKHIDPNIPLISADGAKMVEPTGVPTHQNKVLASVAVRSVGEFVLVTQSQRNMFTFPLEFVIIATYHNATEQRNDQHERTVPQRRLGCYKHVPV